MMMKIQGNEPKLIEYGVTTVYVRTNIECIDEEHGLYEYDEIQYTKDEYIQKLIDEHSENTELLNIILGVIE